MRGGEATGRRNERENEGDEVVKVSHVIDGKWFEAMGAGGSTGLTNISKKLRNKIESGGVISHVRPPREWHLAKDLVREFCFRQVARPVVP